MSKLKDFEELKLPQIKAIQVRQEDLNEIIGRLKLNMVHINVHTDGGRDYVFGYWDETEKITYKRTVEELEYLCWFEGSSIDLQSCKIIPWSEFIKTYKETKENDEKN